MDKKKDGEMSAETLVLVIFGCILGGHRKEDENG